MLVRYHLFYYAVACLLTVMGRYFHALFYIFLLLYFVWLFYRLTYRHVFIALLLCSLVFVPHSYQDLPTALQGRIIKTYDHYCYLKTEYGNVKVYHDENIQFGDHISIEIQKLEMSQNSNDNAFCEQLYLYGQNIFYKAQLLTLYEKKSNFSFYQFLEECLSLDESVESYQRLFLFGERTENIQDDYTVLSQLSLVHLFALSGMHIHILCKLLQNLFGIFFKQRMSKCLAIICIGYYVFSIPLIISLYRAFFCLFLYELGKKWFHELDILSCLVIISLIYNPYYIYNTSFVFSYFIYFIVIITKHLPHSSLWVYLSSIPLILNMSYRLPLFSFLINKWITSYIELFYCFTILSILFPFLDIGILFCIYILSLILNLLNDINCFLVFSKPSFAFVVMFYVLFFTLITHLEIKRSIQKDICKMIALMIAFSFYSQYKIYGEVTMIDVGQGDCTFIRLPMNQGNILIDTGGNRDYDLATQTIIPYLRSIGVRKLDYVYISHSDFDHCGALDSLVKNFQVGEVIQSYEANRMIGPMRIQMLQLETYYSDVNNQSLIMYVQLLDSSLLLTGDISAEVEKELKDKYGQLDVDILKVSHHGSSTATSASLLEMIQPSIAMIGVKKNNLYHHPSDEVIKRLKRKGITILRTDEDGMFHIRFYGKSRYILR